MNSTSLGLLEFVFFQNSQKKLSGQFLGNELACFFLSHSIKPFFVYIYSLTCNTLSVRADSSSY